MNSISFAYLSAVRLGVLVAVILAIRSTIYPTVAFGWGSYGHQQINVAAAKLITRTLPGDLPIGQSFWVSCLGRNSTFLQRMAVTPDVDWKIAPTDRTFYYTLGTIDALKASPGDVKSLDRMKKFAERELKNSFTIFAKDLLSKLHAEPGNVEFHSEVEQTIKDKKATQDSAKLRSDLTASYKIGVFEQPLHFFELDAFLENIDQEEALRLPSQPDYAKAVPEYTKQLVASQERIAKVAPRKKAKVSLKPTVEELSKHGTAPWRTLQLYRLGVSALKAKNANDALFYLGAMGHYVGDLSQPFHATLDFDGVGIEPHAKGLHGIFESDMFDVEAKSMGAQLDKKTRLWSRFTATEKGVLENARKWMELNGGPSSSNSSGISKRLLDGPETEDLLVRSLITLATDSYGPIGILALRFSNARKAAGMPETSEDVPPGFAKSPVAGLGVDLSPYDYAKMRLGQASARVARLWLEAYEDAGHPVMPCTTFSHDAAAATAKYPIPDYIPGAQDQCDGPAEVSRVKAQQECLV
ncbi:MAG: hypothetical protein AAB425_09205, partial [Bdellovibrionota bacterium]